MKTVVLDSYAVITYLSRQSGWEMVTEILQQAYDKKIILVLSRINWGEIFYVTLREHGEIYAQQVLEAMDNMPIAIQEITREIALEAGRWKSRGGISYADCFSIAVAQQYAESELVTGDREFKKAEKEIKIKWIS